MKIFVGCGLPHHVKSQKTRTGLVRQATPCDFRGNSTKPEPAPSPLRILVVGSLPPPVGGTTISLKHLVDRLSATEGVAVSIVNTSGIRGVGPAGIGRFFGVLGRLVRLAFRADVVTLHCATTALPVWGPIVLAAARAARKPLIVRKFAGLDYMELGPIRGKLSHFVIRRADLFLAQTKRLVELAKKRGVRRVEWYPTSRPAPKEPSEAPAGAKPCRRFVFVGHVREIKGIRELIQAAERCEDAISVDVYGPLFADLDKEIFEGCKRVTYRGALMPDEVVPTLRRYDMQLLPSKARSEGYPGAILEGYVAGLPIIASACGAIPEIVDETSGILVEPGNPNALYEAMRRVTEDDALFARLCAGARAKSSLFSSEIWADRFVSFCREAAAGRKKAAERRN